MPLHGQASGGWTESSSALRILNLGIRNSIGVLADDAFTQANPVAVATGISTRLDVTQVGVLSGSVCFGRPAAGNNFVGGPGTNAIQTLIQASPIRALTYRPLGVFINSASGNAYENTPAVASGIGPYVSAMGTYASALYETDVIDTVADAGGGAGSWAIGDNLVYTTGNELITSRNGFLMPKWQACSGGAALMAVAGLDQPELAAQSFVGIGGAAGVRGSSTIIGVVKMAPDAFQTEVVWDQRV